jgi:hypothetical protein
VPRRYNVNETGTLVLWCTLSGNMEIANLFLRLSKSSKRQDSDAKCKSWRQHSLSCFNKAESLSGFLSMTFTAFKDVQRCFVDIQGLLMQYDGITEDSGPSQCLTSGWNLDMWDGLVPLEAETTPCIWCDTATFAVKWNWRCYSKVPTASIISGSA